MHVLQHMNKIFHYFKNASTIGTMPFGTPKWLSSVVLRFSLDREFLNDELRLKLNPLAITLQSVINLPGLVLENSEKNPALRTFLKPTEFSLQVLKRVRRLYF